MFYSFFIVAFAILNLSSCVINKHYYEYYEADIPDWNDFSKILRKQYENYFIEDVYCFLSCD